MKKSIGLVVITIINDKLCALLQIRGGFNPEKMKPESFPGATQVSCHGGLEENEDFETALLREIEEELGNKFKTFLLKLADKQLFLEKLHLIEHFEEEDKEVKTYTVLIEDPNFLKKLQLGPSTGGIRLLPKSEVDSIKNLKDFDKTTGVQDRKITAMFPDEASAVKKAFKFFNKEL